MIEGTCGHEIEEGLGYPVIFLPKDEDGFHWPTFEVLCEECAETYILDNGA